MKFAPILLLLVLFVSIDVSAQGYKQPLEIGSTAPDITGMDQFGNTITLSGILESGKSAVLIFYRGSWCGYCKKHLSQVQDSLEMVLDANASVLVVSPETPESNERMISHTGAEFSIIHDSDYSIMQDYNVDYAISPETVTKYLGPVTKRTADANGNDDGILPVPATYVIGNDGKIRWVHFDPVYSKRSSVQQILEQL